jgi:hypothetical protein
LLVVSAAARSEGKIMAQTGYSPISLYYSTTASAAPSAGNLVSGELALNITDGILFYKDNAGVVQTLATKVATSGTYTSITLTGGTANGVGYLNGSKQFTTGSALTFDGTNFGLGIATPTVNQGNALHINNATQSTLRLTNSTTGTASNNGVNIALFGNDFYINNQSGSSIFYISGSEQMRLTSTGLGIGTSSPGFKLQVIGTSQLSLSAAGTQQVLQLNNSDTTAGTQAVKLGFSSSGVTKASINAAVYGNDYMTFNVGSDTERMRIDASGNLGLGVTPSAWATYKAFDLGTQGSIASTSTQMTMFQNAYWNGTAMTYKASNAAGSYNIVNGQHQWNIAPSGTAGTAISFTQAMTLDESGRLLVGTTSATGAKIDSQGAVAGALEVFNGQNTSADAAAITRLTLGSQGGNWYIENQRSGAPLCFNNGTERARIDSSGNLLVGTTTSYARFVSVGGGTGSPAGAFLNNSSSQEVAGFLNQASGTSTLLTFFSGSFATQVGSISTNGSITLYNTTSDYRLKTVIGDVTGSGARIDALEPVEYEWKSSGERTRGFLAHKFQEVYPGSVTGEKDAVDAEGKPVYQNMQASTSEVIADLVAELQSLRKRVAQLEGK